MNADAHLDRLLNLADLADRKASAAVALVTAIGGPAVIFGSARLFSQPPFGGEPASLPPIGWYLLFFLAAAIMMGATFVIAALVVYPRVRPNAVLPQPNALFFGTAAAMPWEDFRTALQGDCDELVIEQCYQVARIVDAKFRLARRAVLMLHGTLAAALLTATFILQG